MRYIFIFIAALISCRDNGQQKNNILENKIALPSKLNEISGLVADKSSIWAITDKPRAILYKMNFSGVILQEIHLRNAEAIDLEAVTQSDECVYVGDLGDNEGNRVERQIFKLNKKNLNDSASTWADADIIRFRFSEDTLDFKKKQYNFDCEALISMGDSIYLFTKRRQDDQTEIFVLPDMPGEHIAQSRGIINTEGLITDAAFNKMKNELALIGYKKGHKHPFILFINGNSFSDFVAGKTHRIELTDRNWDWQLESISYADPDRLVFACEETKEVKSTMYVVDRNKVDELNKKTMMVTAK